MKKKVYYDYYILRTKIKEYLDYYDLELEDLAIRVGLTKKTLERTLNNERVFYVNEVYKLADILAIDTKDIEKIFLTEATETSVEM